MAQAILKTPIGLSLYFKDKGFPEDIVPIAVEGAKGEIDGSGRTFEKWVVELLKGNNVSIADDNNFADFEYEIYKKGCDIRCKIIKDNDVIDFSLIRLSEADYEDVKNFLELLGADQGSLNYEEYTEMKKMISLFGMGFGFYGESSYYIVVKFDPETRTEPIACFGPIFCESNAYDFIEKFVENGEDELLFDIVECLR